MLQSLGKVRLIEERNLLSGYLAQLLEKYDLAQTLFLSSSKPKLALEMRQNLQVIHEIGNHLFN